MHNMHVKPKPQDVTHVHTHMQKASQPIQDRKHSLLSFFTDGTNSPRLLHPDKFPQLSALQ